MAVTASDKRVAKFFAKDRPPSKRFKHVARFAETATHRELQSFYDDNRDEVVAVLDGTLDEFERAAVEARAIERDGTGSGFLSKFKKKPDVASQEQLDAFFDVFDSLIDHHRRDLSTGKWGREGAGSAAGRGVASLGALVLKCSHEEHALQWRKRALGTLLAYLDAYYCHLSYGADDTSAATGASGSSSGSGSGGGGGGGGKRKPTSLAPAHSAALLRLVDLESLLPDTHPTIKRRNEEFAASRRASSLAVTTLSQQKSLRDSNGVDATLDVVLPRLPNQAPLAALADDDAASRKADSTLKCLSLLMEFVAERGTSAVRFLFWYRVWQDVFLKLFYPVVFARVEEAASPGSTFGASVIGFTPIPPLSVQALLMTWLMGILRDKQELVEVLFDSDESCEALLEVFRHALAHQDIAMDVIKTYHAWADPDSSLPLRPRVMTDPAGLRRYLRIFVEQAAEALRRRRPDARQWHKELLEDLAVPVLQAERSPGGKRRARPASGSDGAASGAGASAAGTAGSGSGGDDSDDDAAAGGGDDSLGPGASGRHAWREQTLRLLELLDAVAKRGSRIPRGDRSEERAANGDIVGAGSSAAASSPAASGSGAAAVLTVRNPPLSERALASHVRMLLLHVGTAHLANASPDHVVTPAMYRQVLQAWMRAPPDQLTTAELWASLYGAMGHWLLKASPGARESSASIGGGGGDGVMEISTAIVHEWREFLVSQFRRVVRGFSSELSAVDTASEEDNMIVAVRLARAITPTTLAKMVPPLHLRVTQAFLQSLKLWLAALEPARALNAEVGGMSSVHGAKGTAKEFSAASGTDGEVARRPADGGSGDPASPSATLAAPRGRIARVAPDSLLTLFGPWFFAVGNDLAPLLHKSRAVAYEALVRVACVQSPLPLSDRHRAQVMALVTRGLHASDAQGDELVFLVTHGASLLANDMPGTSALATSMIVACDRVMAQTSSATSLERRLAAIKALSTVMPLPNRYGAMLVPAAGLVKQLAAAKVPMVTSAGADVTAEALAAAHAAGLSDTWVAAKHLQPVIHALITRTLSAADSELMLRQVSVWAMVAFVLDEMNCEPKPDRGEELIASDLVGKSLQTLMDAATRTNKVDLATSALAALTSTSACADRIISRVGPNAVADVLIKLSQHIEMQMDVVVGSVAIAVKMPSHTASKGMLRGTTDGSATNAPSRVVRALDTLLAWVMNARVVMLRRWDVLQAVLSAVEAALVGTLHGEMWQESLRNLIEESDSAAAAAGGTNASAKGKNRLHRVQLGQAAFAALFAAQRHTRLADACIAVGQAGTRVQQHILRHFNTFPRSEGPAQLFTSVHQGRVRVYDPLLHGAEGVANDAAGAGAGADDGDVEADSHSEQRKDAAMFYKGGAAAAKRPGKGKKGDTEKPKVAVSVRRADGTLVAGADGASAGPDMSLPSYERDADTIRFSLLGHIIVSLHGLCNFHGNDASTGGVRVVVRDMTGTYTWDVQPTATLEDLRQLLRKDATAVRAAAAAAAKGASAVAEAAAKSTVVSADAVVLDMKDGAGAGSGAAAAFGGDALSETGVRHKVRASVFGTLKAVAQGAASAGGSTRKKTAEDAALEASIALRAGTDSSEQVDLDGIDVVPELLNFVHQRFTDCPEPSTDPTLLGGAATLRTQVHLDLVATAKVDAERHGDPVEPAVAAVAGSGAAAKAALATGADDDEGGVKPTGLDAGLASESDAGIVTGTGRVRPLRIDTYVERLLRDPDVRGKLKSFMETEHAEESVLFWGEVEKYRYTAPDKREAVARDIVAKFVADSAQMQVNLNSSQFRHINDRVKAGDFAEDLFDEGQAEISKLIERDALPRFRKALEKSDDGVPRSLTLHDELTGIGAEFVELEAAEYNWAVSDSHREYSRHKAVQPAPVSTAQATALDACRLMICQLGFLSPAMWDNVSLLREDASLLRSLIDVDATPARECLAVAVLYVGRDHASMTDVLATTAAPTDFNATVDALGWEVDLKTHGGYAGGLAPRNGVAGAPAGSMALDGRSAVCLPDGKGRHVTRYWADSTTEVVFHVSTRMVAASSDATVKKRRLIGSDLVHIIWCETGHGWDVSTFDCKRGIVQIVVYPMQRSHMGLYRVHVLAKREVRLIGPLLHDMVVRAEALPELLRLTAINAVRAVWALDTEHVDPQTRRRRALWRIGDEHAVELHDADRVTSLFVDRTRENERLGTAK